MSSIFPVILAGGAGTRLWPLSRKSYPKQFVRLIGDNSLFQESANRLISSSKVQFDPPIVLTNADFRFIAREQLQECGIDRGQIVIEPEAKNTAAAILAACLFAYSKDKNSILLVAPADHVIPHKQDFHSAISTGLSYVQNGKIVTFGIKPTHAETGYGYIELSKDNLSKHKAIDVIKFVEKPNLQRAEEMLVTRNYLWNAGIFLFSAKDMIAAFSIHAPNCLELVSQALERATIDLEFLRLAKEPWSNLQSISIDYAIMEKVKNLVAVPYFSKWTDLGGWDAVWQQSDKDAFGNSISDCTHAIECSDTLLRSENSSQQVVGLGLENIVAIAMPDAVLIANKDRAQDVKMAVNLLNDKKIAQAELAAKDHRPWGWFESKIVGNRFQVKTIFVKPGAALSLQSHVHRSEHWIVVEGIAKVTINGEVKHVSEGQSVYIPLGAIHRLENIEKSPVKLIEVQIGDYLGEDDIERYTDDYGRL